MKIVFVLPHPYGPLPRLSGAAQEISRLLPQSEGRAKHRPCGALWFFLCDQGDDGRKWDGETTFKLEGKRAVKRGPPKKAVSVVAVETQDQ